MSPTNRIYRENQRTADSKPFSEERAIFILRLRAYMRKPLNTINCSWDHSQICANTYMTCAIHRSMFLPIPTLKRIYSLSSAPDHHFAQAIYHMPVMPRTFRISPPPYTGSRSLVPRAHSNGLICMFYSCCVTSHMCQKVNTGDSYIFYFGYLYAVQTLKHSKGGEQSGM